MSLKMATNYDAITEILLENNLSEKTVDFLIYKYLDEIQAMQKKNCTAKEAADLILSREHQNN